MNCREMSDFLMGYISDELPTEQRAEFDRHLVDCSPCVHYLRSYEETIRLGKCLCDDPEGALPEDVPENLIQAILAARAKAPTDTNE